ncbi:MAG: class I SAM-dependent methyltransferase [bacterium]|nr:class I SAM-dependent methyltransferase [bacterium]
MAPFDSIEKNDEEIPEGEIEPALEEEATSDLKDLGLSWEQLKGKKVLDIGAGPGVIAEVAKKKGIEVVSLDMNPEMWKNEGKQIFDVPYVKADAEKLPFIDNSFDVVISHAGPLTLGSSKEFIIEALREAKRILKPNGEIHFGPGNIAADLFEENELFAQGEQDKLTMEERIARIGERSKEFLINSGFDVIQEDIKDGKQDYPSNKYFVIKNSVEGVGDSKTK